MTSSRSRASINSRLASLACAFLVVAFCVPTLAHAEKRKRVVVLEFDGPKAEKFHDDLVRLIKKSHTVIPVDKWNGTAEELDANKLTDKDLKKVAKKLHVDAIVSGKIEKRRDEYLVKLKLRAGKTGAFVGEGIDTKAEGPRLDGKASKDLKDELMDALDALDSNRGGSSGDDEEDTADAKPAKKGFSKKSASDDEEDTADAKPAKKGFSKKSASDDEEDTADAKPAKKGFSKKSSSDDEEADAKPAKKGFSKKSTSDDEETADAKVSKKSSDDEDESPLPKAKKRPAKKSSDDEEDGDTKKKTASKDGEDEEGVEEGSGDGDALDAAQALSPSERAVDVVLGLSLNARRLSFKSTGTVVGYKGVPVAGVLLDGTIYPLAVGHKNKGMLKNLGLTLMYDKVIKINSKSMGMSLPTTESRFAVGGTFRYPFGKAASAPVLAASVRYGKQNFTITGTTELPNVSYAIIDPSLAIIYPLNGKMTLDARLGAMLVLDTGPIQKMDQYGAASVFGVEGEFGGDYALTKNIFARAAFKFETIGFTFKGTGAKAMANAVSGARDNYLGGAVTVGYLY